MRERIDVVLQSSVQQAVYRLMNEFPDSLSRFNLENMGIDISTKCSGKYVQPGKTVHIFTGWLQKERDK